VNATPRRAAWDAALGPRSRALVARDARAFLRQSVSTPCLSAVVKARGSWLEDADGRRWLDFHGNSCHHLGHGHPRILAAIRAQLEELPFAPRRFTCAPAVALAERLGALSPPGLTKVLFATGGSDAIEIALRVARAATGRFKTLSFWDSFHGAGFGASSVGGEALFRAGPIGPLLPGAEHVAPFACTRCPYGFEAEGGEPPLARCRLACARMVRYALERETDVAAVVAEPARAVPVLPPPGYWRAVRQACDDTGTLLVFDEIPTGLGKTGRLFACEHEGVVPDVLVLGKALGGGVLPMAAALCRPELDVGAAWAFGHYTHEKSPVASRAALEALAVIEEEGLVERARRLGERALARLGELRARHPLVADVRGRGLLLGVELADPGTGAPAPDAAEAVLYDCLERGLSFKVSLGNVLTLSPPLVVTDGELDQALGILEGAIGRAAAAAPGGPRGG
jgi:4-aminobutyrate aminotransferase